MGRVIWVFHHYADPPDGHWTGTYDLYKFLVRNGHKVTVFSSSFSHYAQKDLRLLQNERSKEQYFNGMRFVFLKTTPYSKNDWRRALNMLAYGLRAHQVGSRDSERPDVVVGCTPHPFCALAAVSIARRKRARFFLELHDLWAEYMVDTRRLSAGNPLILGLRWLEGICYQNAEIILTLWPGMDEYLKQYGIPSKKIVWMPLGVDFDELERVDEKSNREDSSFVVLCAARFGPASNVDEILAAARILQGSGQDKIRFVLVGGGPEKERLLRDAEKYGLKNVEFLGLVPRREMRRHLAEADVCLGGLPSIPCYAKYGTIPTKMLDYLTSNRPTIFITNIEDNIVQRAGAGIVVPPGDPKTLARAIMKLSAMTPQQRASMARNGLGYMQEKHNLRVLAQRLELLL